MAARLAAGLIAVGLLSACASEPPPPAKPPTSPPPATTTTSTPDDVPRVETPLNTNAFVAAPCDSLTAAQLAELGLGAGIDEHAPGPDSGRSDCTFPDLDPTTDLVVYLFYFAAEDGIGELYAMNNATWTDWTPMEIDGYPAVRFKDYKTANNCDMVTNVATAVLATVKAAN